MCLQSEAEQQVDEGSKKGWCAVQPVVSSKATPRLPQSVKPSQPPLSPLAPSILPHTPHVWILVHSFQMTATGLIWTPPPCTHTDRACGNVIVPLYFYCGLHSVDCNEAECILSFQGRTGPSPPIPSSPLLSPPLLSSHLCSVCWLNLSPFHVLLTSCHSFWLPLNFQLSAIALEGVCAHRKGQRTATWTGLCCVWFIMCCY